MLLGAIPFGTGVGIWRILRDLWVSLWNQHGRLFLRRPLQIQGEDWQWERCDVMETSTCASPGRHYKARRGKANHTPYTMPILFSGACYKALFPVLPHAIIARICKMGMEQTFERIMKEGYFGPKICSPSSAELKRGIKEIAIPGMEEFRPD